MATTTPNFGWPVPTSTDLVKDGATAIEGLGDAIDASLLDLKGGTSGQVLAKNSNTDMDFIWVAQDDSNAIQNAIIDAKGDLITGTANDTPARLAVGTNGHVLTADSTTATGLKWAAAPSGKLLQVVFASTGTQTNITSTTYTDTGLSATITPTSSTSTILVIYEQMVDSYRDAIATGGSLRLLRGSTTVQDLLETVGFYGGGQSFTAVTGRYGATYLDSPATTSATTYKVQGKVNTTANNQSFRCQYGSALSTMTLMEIGA